MRANIELSLKIIATCIALFGVLKYFYDLSLDRDRAAKSAALARIERLGSGEIDDARSALFGFWVENAAAVAFLRDNPTTANAYASFLLPAFRQAQNADALHDAIYELAQHYDDVYFCLDSGVCDGPMIEAFYCPKVTVTQNVYSPTLAALKTQSGYSNFGWGLERLSERCPRQS